MSILELEDWSEPPVDLSDDYYCQIQTKQGVESGWYYRDLKKGKRKGWKVVFVLALGTTDEGHGILRWRKREVSPKCFRFQPRFPLRPTKEMRLARQSKTEKKRDKFATIVREEQGLYWCPDFNTWKRVDGESHV
ncbi:MAG: hypothetical protein HOM01_15335 [Kordiimonadaceae bacterium]|jgi:hypothetical protein|nr:hypothetical protein [Kordiimonadaceae bacterium]